MSAYLGHKSMRCLTRPEILDKFYYEPDTGLYSCLTRELLLGNMVSCQKNYVKYGASKGQLAWFIHYGCWPIQQVDTLDGNPKNAALDNLCLTKNVYENHTDKGDKEYTYYNAICGGERVHAYNEELAKEAFEKLKQKHIELRDIKDGIK